MTNWEQIAEVENFIIDYDKSRGMYRVSYFENNHFVDDVIFDEIVKECPMGRVGTLNVYDL